MYLLIDKINNKFNFQANVAATHSYRTLFGKDNTIYKLNNKMNNLAEKYIDHLIHFEGISDQLKDHRIVSWTDNCINFNKRMLRVAWQRTVTNPIGRIVFGKSKIDTKNKKNNQAKK